MEIFDYTTSGGKNVILSYIDSLPIELKIVAYGIRKKIRDDGLIAFQALNTRKLKGKLYEIKFSNQRIMYVIRDSDRVYFLHICKKQKNKAEKKDIDLAIKRAKDGGLSI
ncbi:MAG: type II toxin-antitoxin system RelE/ParE family toxin [Erysipelotrichaceae bacterium]|nr:type II toxin-antitoxin system RelE/ParE family toxin [Erysipelotrichaceae bacterium]